MSDSAYDRLERLRSHHDWTWAQVGNAIGVKVPMLMMVKKEKRKLSSKAMRRLVDAEIAAGLRPPPREAASHPSETRAKLVRVEKALRKQAKVLEKQADSISKAIEGL